MGIRKSSWVAAGIGLLLFVIGGIGFMAGAQATPSGKVWVCHWSGGTYTAVPANSSGTDITDGVNGHANHFGDVIEWDLDATVVPSDKAQSVCDSLPNPEASQTPTDPASPTDSPSTATTETPSATASSSETSPTAESSVPVPAESSTNSGAGTMEPSDEARETTGTDIAPASSAVSSPQPAGSEDASGREEGGASINPETSSPDSASMAATPSAGSSNATAVLPGQVNAGVVTHPTWSVIAMILGGLIIIAAGVISLIVARRA